MAETNRPLEVNEIHGMAREKVSNLGIATVYRALKDLVEEGWLKKVELPGQAVFYERSDLKHHHHFHCRSCGKVYDISTCPGTLASAAPQGFKVEDHELVLYGQCAVCRKSA